MSLPSLLELSSIAAYGYKIFGDLSADLAGEVVSSIDINGDGFTDLILSAPGNDSGGTNAGAIYVLFGKASGFGPVDLATLSAADGFKIQGDAPGDGSALRTVSAGDVNNDGFEDLLIGAPRSDAGGSDSGAAYLIFGKASGFGPLDLASLSAADGFKILGDPGDLLGATVDAYGDYDDDGYDDFILRTSDGTGGAGFAGTWLIYGKAGGFATLDLHNLSAADGFRLSNLEGVSAGDVNGDGIDDMIIGRPSEGIGANGSAPGAAYVIFGKVGGFGNVNLASLTPADGFRIAGSGSERAGFSVAAAGDFNGDGYDDVIIGAPNQVPSYSSDGGAYVIFGKASGFGPINLATLTAADGFRIEGESGGLAGTSVSAAGDINHDGYGDILVGGTSYSGSTVAGLAYVVFGRPGGFHTVEFLVGDPSRTAGDGIIIRGPQAGDRAGASVHAAGDVNNDGIDDLIVGANADNQGGTAAGAAYVIFGVAADLARADTLNATEGQVLSGSVFTDNGSGADANVDGGALTVVQVNGKATDVGNQIMLPNTFALLRLNANGTFTYNPNTHLNYTPAPESGASNAPAIDRFSYTLAGGSTVIVTVRITGVDSNDILLGTDGNDHLFGGIGNDAISGLAGNDQIDGGTGADSMEGGIGDDSYYVDNPGDTVHEHASHPGFDVIWTTISYTAPGDVEAISTASWEGTAAIDLNGSFQDNTIHGNAGANRLDGREGNDALFGLGGNDTLIGGTGIDVLYGGTGDDNLFVDHVSDAAIEYASEGFDIVWTTVNYALAAGSEIEALSSRFWESTTAIDLFGNEIANALYGNAGVNFLDGGGGNDTLYGFEGNDRLIGGTGLDTMYGGAGDDNYFIEVGDSVVETGGQGFDIAWTSTSFTLAAGSEVEALSSRLWEDTNPLNLTGNEIANSLYGNAGANMLDGGGGGDSLFGFGGADSFRFSTALGAGNIDTIAGFVAVDDTILLDDSVFTALPPGALNPNAFVIGAAAMDADDRIIYNSATGALYYDADGSGAGAAIQFATLQGAPAITASDFQVI